MQEEEISKKFNINLDKLKEEQIKLAKELEIKNILNLEKINTIAAFENIIVRNQIISAVIVCDKSFEVIEEQFYFGKLNFPYLSEFRSYRELPSMLEAYKKLQNKPDIVLISGNGIAHPRLGIASHFSLAAELIPSIGIADSPFDGNTVNSGEIINLEGKKVGRILNSKEKSNPLFISPGNKISVEAAYDFCKSLIVLPHKHPEPLHLAHKYAKSVKKELGI
jgi:deoxyribonuclease V